MAFTKIFFTMLLIIGLTSCEKDDDVYTMNGSNGIDPKSIIFFKNLSPSSIEADGATTSTITIQINPKADSIYKKVYLATNLGIFANGKQLDTIDINIYGTGISSLTGTKPGKALISAKVKSFTVDTVLNLLPALPQNMILTTNKYLADTLQSVEAYTNLLREPFNGKISDPVIVYYTITPSIPQIYSLIYPSLSYSHGGKDTVQINNPFFIKGSFKLEAKTVSSKGDTIKRSINFLIHP